MKKIAFFIFLLVFLSLGRSEVWATTPLNLNDGPHLLIDDYLIDSASRQNVIRRVNHPARVSATPVIPSIEMEGGDGTCSNFNYEVEVVFDPVDNKFKMWYVKYDPTVEIYPAHSVYRESIDGVTWGPCREVDYSVRLDNTQNKGLSSPQRFVSNTTHWLTDRTKRGMDLFFSANGLTWQEHPNNPVLTWEQLLPGISNDIWDLYFDPLRQRYGVLTKAERDNNFVDSRGQSQVYRGRTTHQNTSPDLINWTNATVLFPPDHQDEGQIQWYGCANATRRGDHLICFSKVLHDDFKSADTPAQAYSYIGQENWPVFGIGYTVLAWSYDGDTWYRDRAGPIITGNNPHPVSGSRYLKAKYFVDLTRLASDNNVFFAPNPNLTAWDHAHAWIDSVVPVGDVLYFYYGGYKYGHKIYSDRGIGLAKMTKDRYVGQYVGRDTASPNGSLTTKLIEFDAGQLFLNLDSNMRYDGPGEITVEILNTNNQILATCDRIGAVDSVAKEVTGCDLTRFRRQPVKLRFKMKNAGLYAFYLDGESPQPTLTSTPPISVTPTPVLPTIRQIIRKYSTTYPPFDVFSDLLINGLDFASVLP